MPQLKLSFELFEFNGNIICASGGTTTKLTAEPQLIKALGVYMHELPQRSRHRFVAYWPANRQPKESESLLFENKRYYIEHDSTLNLVPFPSTQAAL